MEWTEEAGEGESQQKPGGKSLWGRKTEKRHRRSAFGDSGSPHDSDGGGGGVNSLWRVCSTIVQINGLMIGISIPSVRNSSFRFSFGQQISSGKGRRRRGNVQMHPERRRCLHTWMLRRGDCVTSRKLCGAIGRQRVPSSSEGKMPPFSALQYFINSSAGFLFSLGQPGGASDGRCRSAALTHACAARRGLQS